MKKIIYLDMDGTIADLYGMENWLDRLINQDSSVFADCRPLCTEEELLHYFPITEYQIIIATMTPKKATKQYHNEVALVKREWLRQYFPILANAPQYFLPYGDDKNIVKTFTRLEGMLIDDNQAILDSWVGESHFPFWL